MKNIIAAVLSVFLPTAANAQIITAAPSPIQMLYSTGVVGGNGADTTADVMQAYTIGASQLANVGDVIHVVAAGTFVSSTDSKAATLVIGGQTISTQNTSAVGVNRWGVEAWLIKTGSNTQSYITIGNINGQAANSGTNNGTLTLTDTSTIALQMKGQNSTTATANTITCQVFIVEYTHP